MSVALLSTQGGRVTCTLNGALATVRIEHPSKRNAMTRAMWLQLRDVFEKGWPSQVRCVLLCGAGDNFCSGGDIAQYPSFRFDVQQLQHFHEEEVWGALSALCNCDTPVLAAIDGACMGAGLLIASSCDLRIATESATFGAPIGRLGFPMAPREVQLVVGVIGASLTGAMLLAAEVFPSSRMRDCGYLTRVVPTHQLHPEALGMAQRIAALAPEAARLNKQTMRASTFDSSPQEIARAYAYAPSAEHREGIAAFLEKRTPQF